MGMATSYQVNAEASRLAIYSDYRRSSIREQESPFPPVRRRSVLGRLFAGFHKRLSRKVARELLQLGFSNEDRLRIAGLMDRNNAGTLSPEEKAELSEYALAGTLLSTLQAQARIALKPAAKAPA